MKNKLIILLFVLAVSAKDTKAQTSGVPDTLVYLQNIVANKAQFIGKPFSVLLDSLKIQIKFFTPFPDFRNNISKESSTSFAFYYPLSVDDHYLSYPRLRISWQPYLNINQSEILWKNNNWGGWSSAVAAYYATGIIADIKVVDNTNLLQ